MSTIYPETTNLHGITFFHVLHLSSSVPSLSSHKQIATSTHYNPLKSLFLSSPTVTLTLALAQALMKLQICYSSRVINATHHTPASSKVPPGHVPVHVGEAMEPPERFTIQVEMLNQPIFVGLLDRTAQELGYQQAGALRILCAVSSFRRLLLSLSSGGDGSAVAAEILSGELHES